jgi:hypothetical protein
MKNLSVFWADAQQITGIGRTGMKNAIRVAIAAALASLFAFYFPGF